MKILTQKELKDKGCRITALSNGLIIIDGPVGLTAERSNWSVGAYTMRTVRIKASKRLELTDRRPITKKQSCMIAEMWVSHLICTFGIDSFFNNRLSNEDEKKVKQEFTSISKRLTKGRPLKNTMSDIISYVLTIPAVKNK